MIGHGWRIAAATSIGTSHIKQGMICQDSYACRLMEDYAGRAVGVFVVSDGAGSASHAGDGSDIACRAAIEAVEVFLANGGEVADVDTQTARSWVENVQATIRFNAEEGGAAMRDYACTLLLAVVGSDAAAFIQVGDGAIVVSDEAGEWSWVHWPQRGDYVNTTYFVTGASATEQMAFDLVKRRIDEVAIFSDGIEALVLHYATKTVHAPFFDKMVLPVRALPAEGVDRNLSVGLEQFLASPAVCERTDDDKTLVLATRREPSLLPGASS